ncbi:MAG: hypothetical protein JO042_05930 [Sinobacteraceae bacterium]|nr:hypothetical protein [Nevskiaceae bacterium]
MAVFPYIQARFGPAGVQLSCALPVLVGALAVSTLPAGRAPREARKPGMLGLAQGSGRQPISWIASIPAIAATVAFSSFAYNLFNFSERTASARGIGLEGMGALLCVAMVCGLSGPAAGFLLGNRIGRAWPLGIAACVGTIGISLLLSRSTGQWGFGLGMTLYFFVYGLGQAFIYAQLMALDTSGRVLILSSPISAAGLVGTAALSVAISGRFGIDGVLWLSLAELIVCAPLIAFSELFNKAHAAKVSAT